MSIAEFYSLPKDLIADLADLRLLLLKPRTLFRKIKNEKTFATVRRLVLYGVVFDALFIALLVPTFPEAANISFRQLLLLGATETLLALFPGIVFYLPCRLLNPAPNLKQVVACAVMVKFLILTPAIFLFAVYLFTESAAIAALRGGVVWIAALSIPILCPLLLAANSKRRFLVSSLSLIMILGIGAGIGVMISFFDKEAQDKISAISLLYDPIGAELDNMKALDLMKPFDIAPSLSREKKVLDSIRIKDNSVIIEMSTVRTNLALLKEDAKEMRAYITARAPQSNDKPQSFKVSRAIVDHTKQTLDQLALLASTIDGYKLDSANDINAFLSAYTVSAQQINYYIEKHKKLSTTIYSALYPRLRLRRWLLEVW